MYTLLLIAANSIPGAILFLVLVAILRQMPDENAPSAAIEAQRSPTTPASPNTMVVPPVGTVG